MGIGVLAHAVALHCLANNLVTRSHITVPRGSEYRFGHLVTETSVPSSNPDSTLRDASAMAARMVAIVASRRSDGAEIKKASWTGAQTSIPRSVARQAARRIISAPFACIGKLRNERGLGFSPM